MGKTWAEQYQEPETKGATTRFLGEPKSKTSTSPIGKLIGWGKDKDEAKNGPLVRQLLDLFLRLLNAGRERAIKAVEQIADELKAADNRGNSQKGE